MNSWSAYGLTMSTSYSVRWCMWRTIGRPGRGGTGPKVLYLAARGVRNGQSARSPLTPDRPTMYTYITMERTQIYLTVEETAALDRIATERGVTRSHLIREAIDATYGSPHRSQRDRLLAVLDDLGPLWRDRDDLPDGETYVERIRAGLPVSGRTSGRPGRVRSRSPRAPR